MGLYLLKLEVRVSRLLVFVAFFSFFVGCYPEPKVEPLRPTVEHIEQMRKATRADGTPLFGEGAGAGRRASGQKN